MPNLVAKDVQLEKSSLPSVAGLLRAPLLKILGDSKKPNTFGSFLPSARVTDYPPPTKKLSYKIYLLLVWAYFS